MLLKTKTKIPIISNKSIFTNPLVNLSTNTLSFHLDRKLPNDTKPESIDYHQLLQYDCVSIPNKSYWTKTIHNLCTKHRNVDEALRLLDCLRLRGFRPDSLNLSSIIHALCDSNRFVEAHHRFALSIIASHYDVPDERTCNVLVARLLGAQMPRLTLCVLYRLIDVKPEFVPSLVNYNRLIDQFCLLSRPAEAHWLFFDMQSRGHRPNVVTFTTLIGGYCKIGQLESAQKVFDEIRESGVVPNSLSYSILIRGVLRKRDVKRGRELMCKLWENMKSQCDQPVNHAAFSNLIDSLCKEGYFQELFRIAEDMAQGKGVCEDFAYAQMIDSLCKAGRHHGASRIVYIMRKRGVIPSILSYNSIIHGLSKDGGHMRAFQLLEEAIEYGFVPSEYTYKVLVEGLCQEQDLRKAQEVLGLMLNKGVDKTRIYNIYLRALCLMNNATELLNVLVYMLQNQCQPDVITLNTVINGFCKMRRIEEALKVLNDMMVGKFCFPDIVTFTTVICGLLDVGRTKDAHDMLFHIMPDKGINPGVVTYNAVLRGLFKLNQANTAVDIFRAMLSNGVAADCTTYTIIIDALCNTGQIEEAMRFWDDTIWPSKVHDNFVYAALLKGLCRLGKFDEACHFLYELVDSGVSPNIYSYNIVIEGACKLGLRKEAYQLVREMKRNQLAPDSVTWRILDKIS